MTGLHGKKRMLFYSPPLQIKIISDPVDPPPKLKYTATPWGGYMYLGMIGRVHNDDPRF